MKKYHIADVLTLVRLVCASLLIFFTVAGVNSIWALLVFVFGELTDALDGAAARTWHYPNDGKRRWWRENKRYQVFDKVADIALVVGLLIYVVFYLQWWPVIWIGVLWGIAAIIVEIWRYFRIKNYGKQDELLTKVVLRRRALYLASLYILCLVLLWWPSTFASLVPLPLAYIVTKATLTGISIIVVAFLIRMKRDRLSEDETPLDRKQPPEHPRPTMRKAPKKKRKPRGYGKQTRKQFTQEEWEKLPRVRLVDYHQNRKK